MPVLVLVLNGGFVVFTAANYSVGRHTVIYFVFDLNKLQAAVGEDDDDFTTSIAKLEGVLHEMKQYFQVDLPVSAQVSRDLIWELHAHFDLHLGDLENIGLHKVAQEVF